MPRAAALRRFRSCRLLYADRRTSGDFLSPMRHSPAGKPASTLASSGRQLTLHDTHFTRIHHQASSPRGRGFLGTRGPRVPLQSLFRNRGPSTAQVQPRPSQTGPRPRASEKGRPILSLNRFTWFLPPPRRYRGPRCSGPPPRCRYPQRPGKAQRRPRCSPWRDPWADRDRSRPAPSAPHRPW